MDAVEWVKKTFAAKMKRKVIKKNKEGLAAGHETVDVPYIVIRMLPRNSGMVCVEPEKFASMFKQEIEDNGTDKKRLAAMKSKKIMKKVLDPKTNKTKDIEVSLGYEGFLDECEKEGLFK